MTVASISRRPWASGLVLWSVSLLAVPGPLAARLWLAVPFVLVPRLAPALAQGRLGGPLAVAPWTSVGAGVLAAGSFTMPIGSAVGAALAIPWLLLTLAGLPSSMPRRGRRPSVDALGRAAADLFLVVGAASLVSERLGIAPLGFDPVIVLLTAVHFSVAGYALLAIAIIGARAGSRAGRWAVLGLVAGIPLTALGWLAGTPVAAWPGTIVVAGAGLLAAASIACSARSAGRRDGALGIISGAFLAVGMVLAVGWSTALVLGVPYLDIAGMVRTHGALNLVAVLLAAALLHVMGGPRPTDRLSGRMDG